MVRDYFERLAHTVDRRWKARSYDHDVFPDIATEALTELSPRDHIGAMDIVRWGLEADVLPMQLDPGERFGQPPITVYNDQRFVIDVYFWRQYRIAIHEHAFAGAFSVLQGSSFHCCYSFEEEVRYSQYLLSGKLRREQVLLHDVGDVHPVRPGGEFIHSLLHTGPPSVSVLIRTDVPSALPQLVYWRPSLALGDPRVLPVAVQKKVQLIRMLVSVQHPDLPDLLRKTCVESDPLSMLHLMFEGRKYFVAFPGQLRELLEALKPVHGDLVNDIVRTFKVHTKAEQISTLSGYSRDPDHQFLFAVLLFLDDPDQILDIVRRKYPDADPHAKTLEIIRDVDSGEGRTHGWGVPIGEAGSAVIEGRLKNRTVEELLHRATATQDAAYTPEELAQAFERLRRFPPFTSLFG